MQVRLIILLIIFLGSIVNPALGLENKDFKILTSAEINFNDVSGPGRNSSSLTDGTTYVGGLSLYARGEGEDLKYQLNLGGRTTNDRRQDLAEFSLVALKGHLEMKSHRVTVGDVYESFSQYSLDSAIKGATYSYYDEEDGLPDVAFVYGYAYPRWENAWKGYDLEIAKREIVGANVSHDFTPIFNTGVSYVRGRDSEPVTTDDTLYDNDVCAIDFSYNPIPGLTVKAESAYSFTDQMTSSGTLMDDYGGNAQKLEITGDGHPSRVVLKYERVSPKFKSVTGSVLSNQEQFRSTWRYKATKLVTTDLGFLWFRNKINDNDSMSHSWKPSGKVTVRRLFGRKYGSSSLSYKFENRSEKTRNTKNHYVNVSHRDRFGKLDNTTSMGLSSYDTSGATKDQLDLTANTRFSLRHKMGNVVLKPELVAGTFFYDNKLTNQTDRILQYSVGFGLDIPKQKISSKITFGHNKLDADARDDSDKIFTRFHLYYRPGFTGFLNQSTISLRGAINDYSYTTSTRDFKEKSISLAVNIPFDLK